MCQCHIDNVFVQNELVQLHMFGGAMSLCLLWGGLAALVPLVLVVLAAGYGLRALKHARATRMAMERLDKPGWAERRVSHPR